MATIASPQFTDSVDLRYFLEPLNAPTHPRNFLDRFPDALYNKAPDSHFLRFMYTLMGPVGIGWLRAQLTEARLALEAAGVTLFDLDNFYGDPFRFGRILTESFDSDISGLLPADVWQQIRAQDEAYRSRAITYMNAARLGTTLEGMRLAGSSGIGQNVDVIENYQYLFDSHSDIPLGLPYYGRTLDTGEFIIRPRPAISQTQQQVIAFTEAAVPFTASAFTLSFKGVSVVLPATAVAADVQAALTSPTFGTPPVLGPGNATVTGGPAPASFIVTFASAFSNQAVPLIEARFAGGSGGPVTIPVDVIQGGLDPASETSAISPADMHHMQVALDYLRPVASFPTFHPGQSPLQTVNWSSVAASGRSVEVLRFVTGTPSVSWPSTDSIHWIQTASEIEAPRLQTGGPQHYVGFHNIAAISAYTDAALSDPRYATTTAILPSYNSIHGGAFPEMHSVMPYFDQFTASTLICTADRALADYPEPLTVSAQTVSGAAFINGIYPADYMSLAGIPTVKYHDDHFWSSQGRRSGADILEIDLGAAQAVNYISLEVTRKPIAIEVDYDALDQNPSRRFVPVTSIASLPTQSDLIFDPSQQNPWEHVELYFDDGATLIFTRFIRLTFTRRNDDTVFGRFLFDIPNQTQTPWSIDVRNLRIGRNVAPSVI